VVINDNSAMLHALSFDIRVGIVGVQRLP
jgi:hypothetical protein